MKKLNQNPFAWFIIVIIFGYFIVGDSKLEGFIVLILAIILAKQIEIVGLLEK